MIRIRPLLALPFAVLTVLGSEIGTSAADQLAQSCAGLSDLYAVSHAQLQACNLRTVPLSGTSALPGGGMSYEYTLPDGQTYSMNQPPSGFHASTASAAEAAAYGLPPAPPASSPGYAVWQMMANAPWAPVTKEPYLVVGDAPITQPPASPTVSPNLVTQSSGNWAGYAQAGSGWTRNVAAYYEPTLGHTNCPNPGVSFWAGIGNKSNALGQDGTTSGSGAPGLHEVFYETLPANPAFPGVTAPAGSLVIDDVSYQGNNNWSFNIYANGANHSYGGNGNYDGSVVEDIVERPALGNTIEPLLNFQSINIMGWTGTTLQPLSPTKKWDMTGFATTQPISNGLFTVNQNSCGG